MKISPDDISVFTHRDCMRPNILIVTACIQITTDESIDLNDDLTQNELVGKIKKSKEDVKIRLVRMLSQIK